MGKIVMLKYIYSRKFEKGEYSNDPAADEDRFRTISRIFDDGQEYIEAKPAKLEDISRAHSERHFESIKRDKYLYRMALLAAGGAIQAAELAFEKIPSFAVIRPPGHHASRMSAWGFCFFNNMAIALEALKRDNKIDSAFVLDIDLHYGDGNVNILGSRKYVTVCNIEERNRWQYLSAVEKRMKSCAADVIAISAGFDNHLEDWGGVLATEDYQEIGKLVRSTAGRNKGGCFAILEGGYNHQVLGQNVKALIRGMSSV